jgi:hypothetical protein
MIGLTTVAGDDDFSVCATSSSSVTPAADRLARRELCRRESVIF